ncbi:hypothetical protein F503_01504 [Ophiostoma piceae UAMH 11346]|uniref:Uncharacterized protein n=1 Tax=Ophiostoma piceae (strain UAMH 11346) TaxID=1262450 RepID=S3CAB5_OPHP1|nr:hypothetical protein F503_01504 [Ophiostoma piceae UAMH 11346]
MLFSAVTAAAVLAGSAFAAPLVGDASTSGNATSDALDFVVNGPLSVTLGSFLGLIDAIATVPDHVLDAGDDATHAWLNPLGTSAAAVLRAPNTLLTTRDVDATSKADLAATTDAVNGIVNGAECAAAVAAAIATDLLPAAKLLKAKALIKALGGVKKVAKLLLQFSHNPNSQTVKEAGRTLLNLVEILLGIDSIKRHCK